MLCAGAPALAGGFFTMEPPGKPTMSQPPSQMEPGIFSNFPSPALGSPGGGGWGWVEQIPGCLPGCPSSQDLRDKPRTRLSSSG